MSTRIAWPWFWAGLDTPEETRPGKNDEDYFFKICPVQETGHFHPVPQKTMGVSPWRNVIKPERQSVPDTTGVSLWYGIHFTAKKIVAATAATMKTTASHPNIFTHFGWVSSPMMRLSFPTTIIATRSGRAMIPLR